MKYLFWALLTGLLLGASWPTYGITPLIFVALFPLLWLQHELQSQDIKWKGLKLYLYSWLSFAVWTGIVVFWLKEVQHPDGSKGWDVFFMLIGINSTLYALMFSLYHYVKSTAGNYYGFLFLPLIWMGVEKITLEWELNFPWLHLGNVFSDWHFLIQWYEYTGAFGGTIWVILINLFLFYGIKAYKNTSDKKHLHRMYKQLAIGLLLPSLWSYYLYVSYEEKGDSVEVLVLQPELNPYTEKYSTSSERIVEELIYLADQEITSKTQFIVGPETSFPGPGRVNYNFLSMDRNVQRLKQWMGTHPQATLLTGIDVFETYEEGQQTVTARLYRGDGPYYDSYNAAIQINNTDEYQLYKKMKLVPGVESFPYASFFEPLVGDLLMDLGGTVATLGKEKEPKVMINTKNGYKIAPIICYESIYGEFVTEFVKKGAHFIFIMTNDSWWGNSQGHKQLLSYAKLRAIETRRAIARSANSGISAFINQRGDVEASLSYGTQGAKRHILKANTVETMYVRYGDYLLRIALFLIGIILTYTISLSFTGKKEQNGL